MHGLVNRAIQCFVRETYGNDVWQALAAHSDLPAEGFETMFVYDDAITARMLEGLETLLQRPKETVLEDLGTYLVSDPRLDALRRLLRFGGETFLDFVHSMDDLPRRAALAVPDLNLPAVQITEMSDGVVRISCACPQDEAPCGFGHALVGILRTLADDYGALVLLEHDGVFDGKERLSVRILSTEFSTARPFQLSARP